MNKIDYTNRKLRLAHQKMALDMKPELFLTLATNQTMSLEQMKRKTFGFLACMDRQMLGRKWAKKLSSERMDGLLYIEHEASNIHVHGLMTRPYCNRVGLQLWAEEFWGKICPSGSVVFKDIGDIECRANYVTKEAGKRDFFERQFFMALDLRRYKCPTKPD